MEDTSDIEHNSSTGDSNIESIDSDGGNDFLEAVNNTAGKKRKHEKVRCYLIHYVGTSRSNLNSCQD